MTAYTVSRLADDAGVSVHIVRDYTVRGLLHPVACTTGGYKVFDTEALQRLCFVRVALEAGIGLDTLTQLYHALDGAEDDAVAASLTHLSQQLEQRRRALACLETQLTELTQNTLGVAL